ncbi:MAG: hypothetical protein B0D88_02255 [Candidatus Sedimenticola endophacoides]|nr:MAG: hypothetical protein B0D88_02255 [Candidatus Sedimenticola endophacoides]
MALNDLARYSHHRGAISNRRIVSLDDGVRFRYKDNADDGATKTLRLSGEEFIRRLVQHILPKGFMRMRHYGFLANCCRQRKRGVLLAALEQEIEEQSKRERTCEVPAIQQCPKCHKGRLHLIRELAPQRWEGVGLLAV